MAETVHVRAGPGGYELERHFDLDDPYLSPPLKGSPSQAPGGSDQGDKAPTGGSRKKPREFHAVKATRIEAARIERENRLLARKLNDMKREPPSQFHAPNGYKSIRGGRQRGMQPNSVMQGRETSKPQRQWPAPPDETKLVNREAQRREIDQENERIARKLEERYKSRKDSFVVANDLGKGIDCRGRWQERTSIYRGAARGSRRRTAERSLGGGSSGVPKTLSVGLCSGCGRKDFYAADGKKLRPCEHCGSVWYCSDTCAKIDWQHHKQMCKYKAGGEKKGSWVPAPAPEDCWVTNAAMAKGRQLLAEKTQRYPGGDATRQIQREMHKVSLQDAERLAVREEVEKRAYYGMDGPRPCNIRE